MYRVSGNRVFANRETSATLKPISSDRFAKLTEKAVIWRVRSVLPAWQGPNFLVVVKPMGNVGRMVSFWYRSGASRNADAAYYEQVVRLSREECLRIIDRTLALLATNKRDEAVTVDF